MKRWWGVLAVALLLALAGCDAALETPAAPTATPTAAPEETVWGRVRYCT